MPNPEALRAMKEAPTPVVSLCTNQSYGIAFLGDGRSLEWGQGLCGELHEPAPPPPGLDAKILDEYDDEAKAALPMLPPPRYLSGPRLPLVAVACGGGHVLAAVRGGGLLCWGVAKEAGAVWPTT